MRPTRATKPNNQTRKQHSCSLKQLIPLLCEKVEGLNMVKVVLLKSQEKGIWVDGSTFWILIKALWKMDEANCFVNEMRIDGVKPDVNCYNKVLSGSSETGRLIWEMRTGFNANVQIYNMMIGGFMRNGELNKARELMDEIGKDKMLRAPNGDCCCSGISFWVLMFLKLVQMHQWMPEYFDLINSTSMHSPRWRFGLGLRRRVVSLVLLMKNAG
ncbi:Pentatricopeptide repeat-containing protein [Carex littledalei]|uniref:Pentatricopeptide repeat-containing protein n=1 Tax=Carex littledalei TaxID=544730 RepID=A0A833V7D8_9POAL|nr:Pentatricopeptide repeat-containing protein [Carex littledalei]